MILLWKNLYPSGEKPTKKNLILFEKFSFLLTAVQREAVSWSPKIALWPDTSAITYHHSFCGSTHGSIPTLFQRLSCVTTYFPQVMIVAVAPNNRLLPQEQGYPVHTHKHVNACVCRDVGGNLTPDTPLFLRVRPPRSNVQLPGSVPLRLNLICLCIRGWELQTIGATVVVSGVCPRLSSFNFQPQLLKSY